VVAPERAAGDSAGGAGGAGGDPVLFAAAEVAGDWKASAAGAGGDPVEVAAGGVAVASAGGACGDPVVVTAGVKRCQAGTRYVRAAGVGQSYSINLATVAFRYHLDCI